VVENKKKLFIREYGDKIPIYLISANLFNENRC